MEEYMPPTPKHSYLEKWGSLGSNCPIFSIVASYATDIIRIPTACSLRFLTTAIPIVTDNRKWLPEQEILISLKLLRTALE